MTPRLRIAFEFLLYAALTTFMLHATWLTWPDAFIDFSRELYLPWRVSCGDVLYRDLAYYFGPVSVYTNATLFALLGRPSIHALFALNFVFWIATLLALRALLRRIASPLAATIAVSSFILLFSFSRYTGIGNDNFLAPYSHEITRGFLFSILALLTLDSALSSLSAASGRREGALHPLPDRRFLLPGFFYALVLFTKPELAISSTASLGLLFALFFRQCRAIPLRPLLAFLLAALAAISLVVIPFAVALHSFPKAFLDTLLRIYLDCFNPELTSLPYYMEVLGTDYPIPHAVRFLLGSFLAFLPFLLFRLAFSQLPFGPLRTCATFLVALLSAFIGGIAFFPLNAALPLAPLVFLVLLFCPKSQTRQRNSPPRFHLSAAFALFALALVSKITFNAGIRHYGFVLALPAFCCAVILAFPGNAGRERIVVSFALFASFVLFGLRVNAGTLSECRTPLKNGTFATTPLNADSLEAALDWLRTHTPPDSTLAVLPEGALINVLTSRTNSTPYCSLELPAWLRYDTSSIHSAFQSSPPDFIVLHRTGRFSFGEDYAQSLMAFLDCNYSTVWTYPVLTPSGKIIPYILVARRDGQIPPPTKTSLP